MATVYFSYVLSGVRGQESEERALIEDESHGWSLPIQAFQLASNILKGPSDQGPVSPEWAAQEIARFSIGCMRFSVGDSSKRPFVDEVRLSVERISPATSISLSRALSAWYQELSKAIESIPVQKGKFDLSRNMLSDASQVCSSLMPRLESSSQVSQYEMYICSHQEIPGVHGVMALQVHKLSVEIAFLLTNPKHLALDGNRSSHQIRGIGSKLVAFAKERARALKKKSLELMALSSAAEFYRLQGFDLEVRRSMESSRMYLCFAL